MSRAYPSRHGRSGFTVIELAVSVGILGLMIGLLSMVSRRSLSIFRVGSKQGEVEAKARRALERIAEALEPSSTVTILPDPGGAFGSNQFTFQQVVGSAGAAAVWSNPLQLRLEYEPGETDDGTDEDGDGLIDEGRVVMTRDFGAANAIPIVLCTGVREWYPGELNNNIDDNGNGVVDERGFNIRRVGSIVSVRLCVEGRDAEGRSVVRTLETTVQPRN
jgi:hypothetical protein